jgi:hypothetical protein
MAQCNRLFWVFFLFRFILLILLTFYQFIHFNERVWLELLVKIHMRLEARSLTVCFGMLFIEPLKWLISGNQQHAQYNKRAHDYEVEEAFEVLAVNVDEITEAD